ncbi:unnamed protein product [Rhizophagus irregularis]|nr:unnamed protein product [Rhizophagus irregularis]
MIQAKARPLAKRPVYETLYPSIKEGKFSRKWVDDFISHETPLAFSNTTVEQRGTRSISTYQLGWMNEDEMIWWIENVWTQRARRDINPRSLLVLDSFTAHKNKYCHSRQDASLLLPLDDGRVRGIEEDGENYDESSNNDYEPDDNSESDSSECELEDNYYSAMYFRIGINIEFLVKIFIMLNNCSK